MLFLSSLGCYSGLESQRKSLGYFLNSILPLFHGRAYAACYRADSGDVLRYFQVGPNEDSWFDENVRIGEEVCLGSVPCGLALESGKFVQKKLNRSLILEGPIKQRDNTIFAISILLSGDCASEIVSLARRDYEKSGQE